MYIVHINVSSTITSNCGSNVRINVGSNKISNSGSNEHINVKSNITFNSGSNERTNISSNITSNNGSNLRICVCYSVGHNICSNVGLSCRDKMSHASLRRSASIQLKPLSSFYAFFKIHRLRWLVLVDLISPRSVIHSKVWHSNFSGNLICCPSESGHLAPNRCTITSIIPCLQ